MNYNKFIFNTIDVDLFQIEDVNNDNACYYRSVANCLNYNTPSENIEDIKMNLNYGSKKIIKEILFDKNWGYSGDLQDVLAKYLQETIYNWIIKNKHMKLEEYNTDIQTLVELTHNISIETYSDIYKYFAGDNIIDYYDTGKIYKSGKKKGKVIIKKYTIHERWGGLPEQIAISEIYNIPIIIISSQKYDLKNNKIVTGKIRNNKCEKNVRFRVLQIIGKKYIGFKEPIFLLWKKHNGNGHYMSLYIKNEHSLNKIYNII